MLSLLTHWVQSQVSIKRLCSGGGFHSELPTFLYTPAASAPLGFKNGSHAQNGNSYTYNTFPSKFSNNISWVKLLIWKVFGLALVLCSLALMSSAAPSNGTSKARQGPASSQPSVLPVKTGTTVTASPSRPVVVPVKTGTGAQSVVVPAAGAGNQARPRPARSALNTTVHREADKSSESDEVKDSDEAPQPARPQNPLFRPLHFQPAAASQQGSDSSDDSAVPAPSHGVRTPSSPTNRTLPVTAAASANNGTGSGHKFLGFTF